MKVIFITREGYNLSGARVRCYNFAQELRKYGIDTEVFSFADSLGAKYGEKELGMSSLQKAMYNIKAFKILLHKERDSVFFIQRLNYHTLSPFLVSLLKKNRFIFDCDDWNIREGPLYYLGFMPSSKMEFLTRKIARYADICIAASVFLRDYLHKFNNKVHYIPTGVDTEVFRPGNTFKDISGKVTLCWIGTVYHKDMYMNLRFVVEVFTLLAKRYNNVFLSLGGEGRYFDKLKAEIQNSALSERIILNGWIHPDNIPTYLDSIDIGLFPLFQDTKFNKAKSPTKLFEYMAMAKPVVSSYIGESLHIIKDGEDGFLARTEEDFVDKLSRLIEEPALRRHMGEEARHTVENNFSLGVLGERLNAILKSLP